MVLTLEPIDLSIIPKLGHAEEKALSLECDKALYQRGRDFTKGFFLGAVSIATLFAVFNAGTDSIVNLIPMMFLVCVSAVGAVSAGSMLVNSYKKGLELDLLLDQLLACGTHSPFATQERLLHIAAYAWNEALVAWQLARDTATLKDPEAHRQAIVDQAEKLLKAKRRILDAIEILKPHEKLLTPIE